MDQCRFIICICYCFMLQSQGQHQHRSRYAGSSTRRGEGPESGSYKTAAQRRARSEGPINRRPQWRATSFKDDIRPTATGDGTTTSSYRSNLVGGSQQNVQVCTSAIIFSNNLWWKFMSHVLNMKVGFILTLCMKDFVNHNEVHIFHLTLFL